MRHDLLRFEFYDAAVEYRSQHGLGTWHIAWTGHGWQLINLNDYIFQEKLG